MQLIITAGAKRHDTGLGATLINNTGINYTNTEPDAITMALVSSADGNCDLGLNIHSGHGCMVSLFLCMCWSMQTEGSPWADTPPKEFYQHLIHP